MFSINSFENLFRNERNLEADLKKFSLKDILNFPYASEAGLEEYFIQERLNDNELIVNYHRSKMVTGGIHHISYLPEQSLITIESSPEKNHIYRYLLLIIILPVLLIASPNGAALFWVGAIAIVSIIWILAIRHESAELKRELTIRINYTLRTGKKVNLRN